MLPPAPKSDSKAREKRESKSRGRRESKAQGRGTQTHTLL
jgi:hypothetical protein